MNKKAFTLIELIAVIVILAIIMLIAVPKILDVIETSKKNSLVSGTKIIAKAIQADSLSTGKKYYKLDSLGILYRCNDGEACTSTTQVKYSGKLIPLSGDSVIFVKNTDGSVELQSGATICDKSKKYCITASNGDIPLKSVKIDNIDSLAEATTSSTASNTVTNGSSIIANGDISEEGSSVTFSLTASGVLTIAGTGETKSSDSDGSPWFRIASILALQLASDDIIDGNIAALAPQFGLSSQELIAYMSYFLGQIYGSPATSPEEFEDYVFAKYGRHTQVFGDGSSREAGISDIESLLTLLFGEENMNTIFEYPKVNSVVFEYGVIKIGDNCFRELGINNSNMSLSNSIINIGVSAFQGNELTSVTIPNSVEVIESYAFADNNLTSIIINEKPQDENGYGVGAILVLEQDSFCNNPLLVNPTFYSYIQNGGSSGNLINLGGTCK